MRSHGFQREERGDQSSLTEQANVKPYPPPQGETEARERRSLAEGTYLEVERYGYTRAKKSSALEN